jgi:hypothetical protein
MAVARGEQRVGRDEPKVWFTSTEPFAKVLSAGNRELLRIIAEEAPGLLDELARITGKAKASSRAHCGSWKATACSAWNGATGVASPRKLCTTGWSSICRSR